MYRFPLSLALLLVLMVLSINPAIAQHLLISASQQAMQPELQSEMPLHETRAAAIHLPERISSGELLSIEVTQGEERVFEVIRVSEFVPGIVSVSARQFGNPNNFLTANWHADGRMLANILLYGENRFYRVQHNNDTGLHVLGRYFQEELDILECSEESNKPFFHQDGHPLEHHSESTQKHGHQQPFNAPVFPGSAETTYTTGTDNNTIIDVLLVYTPNAANWASNNFSGGIEDVVAEMMNLSQLTLDNSRTYLELRVVGLEQVAYSDDGNNAPVSSGIHLRRVTTSPNYSPWGSSFGGHPITGFMDEVHDWRDELGADMVSALMQVSDVGGIAWLGGGPYPEPNLMFSVNRVQQMTSTYTFIHELGHNLGVHHSRNQNSSPAGTFGAAFDYSTGWRFIGQNDGQSYATVMTYAQQSTRIPYFSNPDVEFQGTPTGDYFEIHAPADAARTIRNTAPFVAGNFAARYESPSLSMDTGEITLTLAKGQTETLQIPVNNTGESTLMIRPEVRSGVSSTTNLQMDGDWIERHLQPAREATGIPENYVWGSSFEGSEDFFSGTFSLTNDWKVYSRQTSEFFQIAHTDAIDGNQYLRLVHQPHLGTGASLGVTSAYQTYFPNSAWRFSTYIRINNPDLSDYIIHLYDSSARNMPQNVAYVAFQSSGFIRYGMHMNGNQIITASTGVEWVKDEFKLFEIVYIPEDGSIHFFYDEEHIATSAPLSAKRPLQAVIDRTNIGNNSTGDFDAFYLETLYEDFEFVTINQRTYSIADNGTATVSLDFDTTELDHGVYGFYVDVYSNDPDNKLISIPVELTVSGTVSVPGDEKPVALSLDQNYPNPFNPTTSIRFQLPEAGNVSLDVFNVVGQKVATLVNGNMSAGSHTVGFDASALSSGIYIYRIQTPSGTLSRKMMLVK